MDSNQQYYLDKYTKDLNVAYNDLHDSRVDYDTFKPIAESSKNKTINAKKVFDNLAPSYIYYPDFLKSLQLLYLNSKSQSDADQDVLKQKSDALAVFQKKYNDIVSKINALEIQIYEEELAADIQNLVNVPENMVQSDELIIAKAAADKAAAEKSAIDKAAADKAAADKAAIAPKVTTTESGTEVCLDSMGNQIDMSICRPSTGGGGTPNTPSAPSAQHIPTAAELVAQSINSWLQQYQPKPETPAAKPDVSSATKPDVSSATKSDVSSATKSDVSSAAKTDVGSATKTDVISDEKPIDSTNNTNITNTNDITTEDYINSFVFNVDLSKLKTNQSNASDTTIGSTNGQTLDDLGLGSPKKDVSSDTKNDVSSDTKNDVTSGTKNDVVVDNSTIDKIEYNPIIVPDSTNNSRMVFGAAALAVIVAYNLIKKKD
jgi:hypothetical protein